MTKLIVVFRNFANASKNGLYIIISLFLKYFFKHVMSVIIKKSCYASYVS